MAKDLNATGRWLKKIAQGFVGEPQDRKELLGGAARSRASAAWSSRMR